MQGALTSAPLVWSKALAPQNSALRHAHNRRDVAKWNSLTETPFSNNPTIRYQSC